MLNKKGKSKELIIVGTSAFAEIAYEYFTHDLKYKVIAFSAEREYINKSELFGLPIIPFEDLEKFYDPEKYDLFVAIAYNKLNRTRERLYKEAKNKGFHIISYVSPKAFVWRNVEIGENCFIFENNVIQPFVKIGNNVIIWSGNHIGHHSIIEDNCFISSHVVISGFCKIGEYSFLGVNSTIINNIEVGKDVVVGAGAVVTENLESGKVYVGNPARPIKSSYEYFGIVK